MATLTDAGMRPSFDQKWDLKVLQSRYGKATIGKCVLNRSALVEESGEIINISIKPRVAGGTVAADGTFTSETLTFTNVQVNVNTWRYVSHIITDKQSKQSILTLETELPSQFGERLAEFAEIDLADLFLDFTGYNGTAGQGVGAPGTGVAFGRDEALNMVQAMRRRQIPPDSIHWILPVEAFYQGWLRNEVQTNANTTGNAKSTIITGIYGFKQMILGFPAYESTLLNGASTINIDTGAIIHGASGVNVTGTTAGALIHEESLAYAFQINAKYEKVRTTPSEQFGTLVAANSLYGVRGVRANHGVPIYITNGS